MKIFISGICGFVGSEMALQGLAADAEAVRRLGARARQAGGAFAFAPARRKWLESAGG